MSKKYNTSEDSASEDMISEANVARYKRGKKKKKKKKHGCLWHLFMIPIRLLFILLLIGVVGGVVLGVRYYPTIKSYVTEAKETVENSTADTFRMNEASYIYDKDKNVLAKLRSGGDSAYLTYDEIPEAVVDAFVAVEDNTFWDNPGYDLKGIARVLYHYVKSKGEEKHGASTITQQLARTVFLSQEVTMSRKVKEILIASELTKKYDKTQIMEFYVNDVYFANGYYGIEAAAKGYFGKSASELSLSQIAYLCAIPNRPAYYDPFKYPDNAISRRDKILGDMKENGDISDAEYEEAVSETITVKHTSYDLHNYEATYAISCAVKVLMKKDGFEFKYHFDTDKEYKEYTESYEEEYDQMKGELYTGGYHVYTSIDEDMQETLQTAVDENLAFDDEKDDDGIYAFQGAATAIDNSTGKVVAIVGGRSQEENGTFSLNRAFQSYRQPGSTIKPLVVYTPALELGYLPESQLQEIDVSAAKKATKKSTVSAMTGTVYTLRAAVEQSKNGCAYSLFNKIGIKYGLSFIESMKFEKIVSEDYTLSAALGGLTHGTTTAEMASAYAAIADYGKYRDETCIISLQKGEGDEAAEYYEEYSEQVYEEEASKEMLDVLAGVMTNGTGRVLEWDSDVEAVGKTGTTNGSKDGWFCGATPYYTISVWCGYDTPRTLDSLYGGSYPGRIWKQAMEAFVENKEAASFEDPEVVSGAGDGKEYLYWLDGNTLLSQGYTVNNYRSDFTMVDTVTKMTVKMKNLDKTDEYYEESLNTIYEQAQELIDTIYGTKAKNQAQDTLDSAYYEITGHSYVASTEDDTIKAAAQDDEN